MRFKVAKSFPIENNGKMLGLLFPISWDDWFEFETKYSLIVFDEDGQRHVPGTLKIGQRGLVGRGREAPRELGYRYPAVPDEFDVLPENLFSLGQAENYYETISSMPESTKSALFTGLRDVVVNPELFRSVRYERVTTVSLMREVSAGNITGRYSRLAKGDTQLTEFYFQYNLPISGVGTVGPEMDFHVRPHSKPPTNVHVLIGRNGVGKTRFMRGLAQALLGRQQDQSIGTMEIIDNREGATSFSGLVMVSFSAFDDFNLSPKEGDTIKAVQVGIRQFEKQASKSFEELASDFSDSFEHSRSGPRANRWRHAVNALEIDDLFALANVTSLIGLDDSIWRENAVTLFRKLSSGHAIVLLTITRLVELVDERTLVLIDEPEAHLHPPLLSAFIRSLSDLLVNRNGVAIVATHSPVVLQEVPKSCTWMLRRSGYESRAERPADETFGQNISVLTREVFGLEVTKSGFHQLVESATNIPGIDYEGVLAQFEHQLGSEGKALARALIAERDASTLLS